MYFISFSIIPLALATIPTVSACEGPCIAGITNAVLGNYTTPIHAVLTDIAQQISTHFLSTSEHLQDPLSLVQPLLTAYKNVSYNSLETAIFPSYFHGKCQRFSKDGQNPPGCPNPDCPVVCGTPGSLIHFYPTLRYIAFNDTKNVLGELVNPETTTFKEIQKMVEDAQHLGNTRRLLRIRGVPFAPTQNEYLETPASERIVDPVAAVLQGTHGQAGIAKRSSSSVASDLARILLQIGSLLEKACGGSANDNENALPECSWEGPMKAFILSFP